MYRVNPCVHSHTRVYPNLLRFDLFHVCQVCLHYGLVLSDVQFCVHQHTKAQHLLFDLFSVFLGLSASASCCPRCHGLMFSDISTQGLQIWAGSMFDLAV